MLADSYGRIATDLRVSLTDRCNLRCTYCMPPEGLDWLPKSEQLSNDELSRLLGLAVQRLGITEVRFTGGEPLLRRGLPEIVARTAALTPRPEISITTNGIGLARLAGPLRAAGLDRINVSLDTVDQATFVRLSRRDRLADVLAGLEAAASAGLTPVKVNSVLMRGSNDHEAVDLLQFCLDRGYQLRFIEQMPLDAQHGWRREDMITADEILTALAVKFELAPDDPDGRGSAPGAHRPRRSRRRRAPSAPPTLPTTRPDARPASCRRRTARGTAPTCSPPRCRATAATPSEPAATPASASRWPPRS